ncbi:hypothetical protein GGR42_002122 [Saonia flava]|uniref:Uncharacterized protein n=1 Tax=Saonia flava TaxID=523696 RepID=A0A846QXJ0_9FLAO|nr:hypothetical protein [Saonia flava]NJB71660.1 hypothetical protein [Saonia flava]
MFNLVNRIIRTSLWLLALVLFTSGKSTGVLPGAKLEIGNYVINASGDLQKEFQGEIEFEEVIIKSIKGVEYSTLRLNLKNRLNGQVHSMQFLISKERKNKNNIREGVYRVGNHIEGFINCFDGVFGFANIKSFGELPFFANSGKIRIEHVGQDVLKGSIAVTMKNTNNNEINIQGSFSANKKK